jgi:hypothetical protein
MRAIYPLFIFFALFACKSATSHNEEAQKANNEVVTTANVGEEEGLAGDTAAIIAKIRTQYQAIKSDSAKDTHQKLETECEGLFGAINFQSQKDKIRMISYSYGSDHSGITEEYYFQNDSLMFIFEEEGGWMFDPTNPEKTVDEVTETRYYFHNNQIIRAIRKHAKGPTENVEKLLNAAKNETLKGEKAEKWLKKVQELKSVSKSKKLEVYLCK